MIIILRWTLLGLILANIFEETLIHLKERNLDVLHNVNVEGY